MFKLLNANFSRLKHNKVLYVIIIITIGIALFFIFNNFTMQSMVGKENMTYNMDKMMLNYINIVGLFLAMFTSLFIGTEYDYGTIRNKIIVGHTRTSIYFSNLIISIVVGLLLEIVYMLIIVGIGIPLLANLELSLSQYLIIFLEIIVIIIAYSSFFTLISFACSNVTFSTTACMLLLLGMYVVSSNLAYPINMPKNIKESYYDEQGVEHVIRTIPNPNYPSEEKMFIYKNIYYSIPTGQGYEISEKLNNADTFNLLAYSGSFICIVNIVGVYVFNKKELK